MSTTETTVNWDILSLVLTILIIILTARNSKVESADLEWFVKREQAIASNTREKGSSAVFRNRNTFKGHLKPFLDRRIKTIYDLISQSVDSNQTKNFLGQIEEKKLNWTSFETVGNRINKFGSGLLKSIPLLERNGYPSANSLVGIHLINCPEWIIADYACASFGLTSVVIHESYGLDTIREILSTSELPCLITCSSLCEKILSLKVKTIQYIILADLSIVPDHLLKKGENAGCKILSFEGVEHNGQLGKYDHYIPKPDDVYTICFTSGTRQKPKGVVLTHENVIASLSGMLDVLPLPHSITDKDRHLSFMPLSFTMERILVHMVTLNGASIALLSKEADPTFLPQHLRLVQPTIFPSAPKLLLKIANGLKKNIAQLPAWQKLIFQLGFSRKESLLVKHGRVSRDTIWDRLVFKSIQSFLGGKVRLIISGSSQADKKCLKFLRIVLGCPVIEGYGLTETFAGGTMSLVGDHDPQENHVGPPISSCEIKVVDCQEKGYFITDDPNPRGIICIRGPCVAKEYFKSNQVLLDRDGWFHTGDIGELLPDGTICLIN